MADTARQSTSICMIPATERLHEHEIFGAFVMFEGSGVEGGSVIKHCFCKQAGLHLTPMATPQTLYAVPRTMTSKPHGPVSF